MTRLNERLLDSIQFKRRKATADTERKIVNWEIWACEEPTFQHYYDRAVSLYVREGTAVLTFEDGAIVDLQPGDFLTIEQGASAKWVISTPIHNSFCYHDTFASASNRAQQVRWQQK